MKTLWQKEKLHVLCNFFFFHYVFKKPSAAEASESVYMRERVNLKWHHHKLIFYSISLLIKRGFESMLLTLSHIQTPNSRQLLKTSFQKEKLLMLINFSFCENVFNSIRWLYSRFFIFLPIFQSCLLQICCMWENRSNNQSTYRCFSFLKEFQELLVWDVIGMMGI